LPIHHIFDKFLIKFTLMYHCSINWRCRSLCLLFLTTNFNRRACLRTASVTYSFVYSIARSREKKRDPNLNNSNTLATDHTHLHMVRSLLWVWHRINMVQ
jgi:hypothetical protein